MADVWDQFPDANPQKADPWAAFPDASAQQGAPSLADQAKRQLGRTARITAEGITYLPLAAADFGVGARNLLTGSNYESPSSMFAGALDSLGLPRAEGKVEKAVDFVGQALVGSVVPNPGIKNPAPNVVPIAKPNAAKQVIAEGEKRGVPVFYDDVGGATAKKVGTAMESLPGPIGTGAGRARQAQAAQSAATKLVSKFTPNTSDDVPELVQKGLQSKLQTFRTTAGKLYERAANALDPLGTVSRSNLDSAISQEAGKQQRLGTLASNDVASLLEKYRNAPQGNFTLMRELRSQIGDDISDFYTGKNAAIGEKGVTALKAMKEALEKDMEQFAKQSGGNGYQAWRNADGFYKANIVPFREAGFRDLVKTAEPEKAWRYLLAQGGIKSRAARMYNSLDDSGRGAVRYGLIKDAMDNGTNPNGSFSPAKFSKYLEDNEAAVNAFFKGNDRAEIEGFRNLMRHIERAGQFAENPPTGNRLIPYLIGGAVVVNPKVAVVAGGTGLTVRALFQTPTGRNLLLAARNAKPGSPAMAQINDRMARLLAASVGIAALKTGQEAETTPPAQ